MLKTSTQPHQLAELTNAGKTMVAGVTMSTGGAFWTWVGTNHKEIGALCAMIGCTCTVIALIVTLSRKPK